MRDPNDTADLPSPYLPHPAFGLLHLPRFIAKIRLHLKDELPKGYQRNFTRGFDGFLCLHLGIDPKDVIELKKVRSPCRNPAITWECPTEWIFDRLQI